MLRMRRQLIENFGSALRRRSAAAFLGAGLSQGAGYPTWQGLLKDAALELGLDVRQDCDLVDVAQFVVNEDGGERARLNQLIKESFETIKPVPEAMKVLARLPLANIWTTNYDTLMERAYAEVRRSAPEVKRHHGDLTLRHHAQTVLYKMHGSVETPESCVITKHDFETYARDRAGFLHLLAADYIEKTFLFLGLSFRDPNINYLLATIRSVFRGGAPSHYAVMQYPQKKAYSSSSRYEHDFNRFKRWTGDMTRYGINVFAFNGFDEIDQLLDDITIEHRRESSRHSVYVNGSFGPDSAGRLKMERLCRSIGEFLADRQKRLATGLGLVVGASTLRGFIERLDDQGNPMHGRLFVRSILKGHPLELERRRDLMMQCETWILIGGGSGTEADVGVARSLSDGLLIPIPGTGGTADVVAREILNGPKSTREYRVVADLKKAKFSVARDGDDDISAVVAALKRHLTVD